nr:MAG TPA_asm: hypothetical protein [Caudoviricetes sp.]
MPPFNSLVIFLLCAASCSTLYLKSRVTFDLLTGFAISVNYLIGFTMRVLRWNCFIQIQVLIIFSHINYYQQIQNR